MSVLTASANIGLMPSRQVFLCAISNISSGSCNEDCSFCTQSVRFKADINRYRQKPIDEIVIEAKRARDNMAIGFCLVTAGKGITPSKLEFICEAAKAVKKEVPNLNIIACNGTATIEELKILKESGVGSYNHNLESSQAYYEQICTTHSWEERYQTCLNVKEVGLNLCSGGIFGMGESENDRESLIQSICELEPASVAMNFFHPNVALPLEKTLDIEESLSWIRKMRKSVGDQTRVMVAGGREISFKDRQGDIFKSGANSIVVGNYLTTTGNEPHHDIEMIKALGLEIAVDCNG